MRTVSRSSSAFAGSSSSSSPLMSPSPSPPPSWASDLCDPLPLSAVRARVREDSVAARRAAEAREATRKLRDRYHIDVEETP